MMEAASTSETSVNFYQTTQQINPEDSLLYEITSKMVLNGFDNTITIFLHILAKNYRIAV
jgi:hypothetical protein